jgi:hypothetical protein
VGATELSGAMYKVTSAGYDGAAALGLLKAAEQGAKAEQADGVKVADALSSAMRDYYPAASSAEEVTKLSADTMSKMVAATSTGKMTFDQLAGGMSTILPIASQAHISLNDVLATLASMTVHGVTVDQATQQMANAIQHLQNPSQQMSKQMAIMGIDAREVAQQLGEKGLSGTLQGFSVAISKHMAPGSDKVILDLNDALKKSSPAVMDLGAKLMDGSISYKEFTKAAGDFGAVDRAQSKQFLTLINATHQLGSENLAGGEVMQTYAGEMAKLTGTSSGLQVALETTGQNADYTSSALGKISEASADANGNVMGWSQVQDTMNQQLDRAKGAVGSLFIEMGTHLLPALTAVASTLADGVNYLTAHSDAMKIAALVVGVTLLVAVYSLLPALGAMAVAVFAATWEFVAVVAGISAFVVGIVWLYNNVQWFHDFVNVAFANIKKWATVAFDAIMTAARSVIGWVKDHWGEISAVAMVVFHALLVAGEWLWGVMKAVWSKITDAAIWAFRNIVKPIWNAIQEVIGLFIPIVNAVRDHWDAIVTVAKFDGQVLIAIVQFIWGVVSAVFTTGVAIVKGIWDLFWNVLVTVVSVAWHLIQGVVSIAWDIIIGVIKIARDLIMGIISVFLDLITGQWGQAWEDIKHTVGAVWDDIFNLVKGAATSFGGMLKNIFSDLAGGVSNIFSGLWKDIGNIFVTGVNGSIKILNGFLSAINTIAGAVGITLNLHVDEVGAPAAGGGSAAVVPRRPGQQMANGGRIGGGFLTNGPEVLVGEGNAAYPEYVIPTDPTHRQRAKALFGALGSELAGGMPGLDAGGAIGAIGSAVGGAAGSVWSGAKALGGAAWDGAKDVASAASSVAKMGLAAALKMAWPELPTSGNAVIDLLPQGGNFLRGKAIDFILGKDTANKAAYANVGGGSGAIPTGDHLSLIDAALAADGINHADWGRWEAGMNTLIGRESGWNPGVFNNWDSNAAAGMPSGGLTQTIGPTFEANRNPALSANMLDPVSNIAASINYITRRYGDISAVQQANPNLPPLGYAAGGIFGMPFEGREGGGRVNAGQPYIVGETRPEVFVPDVSGTVTGTMPVPRDGGAGTGGGGVGIGAHVVFEEGAIVIHESGDPRATFNAVKMAVQDALARQ